MSTTLLAATTLADASTTPLAAGGFIDWGNEKAGQVGSLFRVLASVIAVGFVIWQGVKSHGAMARIIMAGLAAGVFVYLVFNVTSIRDRVGTEIDGMPTSPTQSVVDPAAPTGSVLALADGRLLV